MFQISVTASFQSWDTILIHCYFFLKIKINLETQWFTAFSWPAVLGFWGGSGSGRGEHKRPELLVLFLVVTEGLAASGPVA